MPLWAWIAIGAGGVAVVAAVVVAAYFAYRGAERRALLRLISRREAVTAVGRSLEDVVTRMAHADQETIDAFVADHDHVERHVLEETASRARMLTAELDTMPMPRRLTPVAESLADAAHVVAEESGKVEPDMKDGAALDALARIDLERLRTVFSLARGELQVACEVCHLEDESVYGGGLYL